MMELPPDEEISALIPVYTERGDAAKLILRDGSERMLPVSTRSVLKALADRHCKSVPRLRRWAETFTHRELNNPVAPSSELVLVPVKTRRPRVSGDEAMGHVNAASRPAPAAFAAPRAAGGARSEIRLPGGAAVKVEWSLKTTRERLGAARRIAAELALEEEARVLRRLSEKRR